MLKRSINERQAGIQACQIEQLPPPGVNKVALHLLEGESAKESLYLVSRQARLMAPKVRASNDTSPSPPSESATESVTVVLDTAVPNESGNAVLFEHEKLANGNGKEKRAETTSEFCSFAAAFQRLSFIHEIRQEEGDYCIEARVIFGVTISSSGHSAAKCSFLSRIDTISTFCLCTDYGDSAWIQCSKWVCSKIQAKNVLTPVTAPTFVPKFPS